jgi:hypothetical protein
MATQSASKTKAGQDVELVRRLARRPPTALARALEDTAVQAPLKRLARAAAKSAEAATALAVLAKREPAAPLLARLWAQPPLSTRGLPETAAEALAAAVRTVRPAWGSAWAMACQADEVEPVRKAMLARLAGDLAPPTPDPARLLLEAALLETDAALADALVEAAAMDQALSALVKTAGSKRASPSRVAAAAETAEAEALMARQALVRAALARGLEAFTAPGEDCPFDPARHAASGPAPAKGAPVRVVAVGVRRGEEVLRPALVKAAPSKPKAPKRKAAGR